MGMFLILGTRVILKSLQEFQKNLLRDLTPSSFQISETREPEVRLQLVCHRIKRSSDQNIAAELQLCCSQRIVLSYCSSFHVDGKALQIYRSGTPGA